MKPHPEQFQAEIPVTAHSPSSERPPRDLDFSPAVLEELYSYPLKRRSTAYALWLLTGWAGGHRLYLDRTITGLMMLFTGGMAGIWWFIDAFRVGKMVRVFNADQVRRQYEGLPPRQLAFMPALADALPPRPHWAAKRSSRLRLVADFVVMAVAAGGLGAYARNSDVYEPVVAVAALIAITLLGTRWSALSHLPVLRAFDRWAHRLRLFYFANDPGAVLSLIFRQVLAIFAFFRSQRRAEVKLYLQLGAWFTILFTAVDVVQALGSGGDAAGGGNGGAGSFVRALGLDMFQTFFATYAFAAPIGATLNKQVLVRKSDWTVWVLSGVAILYVVLGFAGIGIVQLSGD